MSERAVADSAAVWGKRDDMIVRGQSPFNAEPPAAVLANSEITPVDGFYARNHGPFPYIAAQQWRLTVGGLVDRPLMLT
jgi:sulfite oxidase